MKEVDLKTFHIGEVDESELHQVLLAHFGRSEYISADTQHFHSDTSDRILDLKYSTKHKILACTTNLNKQEIQELKSRVEHDLIENQSESVGQVICFSHDKITGFFRYKDVFQLIPADPDFADTPYSFGDHPVILQFRYSKSSNSFFSHMRRTAKAMTFVRFLSVVTKSPIFMQPKNTRFFWAVEPQDGGTVSKWMQTGYAPPAGFSVHLEEYSDTVGMAPIPLVSANEYYGQGFSRSTQEFSLPDNIDFVLGGIFALPPDKFEKFRIASTWLAMVGEIAQASSSAGYVAIVASLESLLDKASETCETCGQPKFSVTKRIKEFLKKYVPGLDQHPKELDRIYRTRSDLAHGLNLLLGDLETPYLSNKQSQSEFMLQISTAQIARVAVLNWLLEEIDANA